MIVVAKFGGTSLSDGKQFEKVKNIIDGDDKRRVVVVSAPGKRNESDNKVTDMLYLMSAQIKYGFDCSALLKKIFDRYDQIKRYLGLTLDIEGDFERLKSLAESKADEESIVCFGEYMCARLMSDYLGYTFVDSRELIYFGYDGKVDDEKTCLAVKNAFEKHKKIVVPGFYGAYPNGGVKLFSRGGSDITGSIIAKALEADKYENWTDVSGILMADPRVIDNPKQIKEITYEELRELSYMGASVLHEETIFPIQDLNIPIQILNTNAPKEVGTVICRNATDKSQVITGIAGKKGFKSFTIVKRRVANKQSVIMQVLQIFDKFHLTIEHIPTSIDSFSLIVDSKSVAKCTYDLIHEIKLLSDVIDIVIDDDIALLAVVGRNMVTKVGISGKIFAILAITASISK